SAAVSRVPALWRRWPSSAYQSASSWMRRRLRLGSPPLEGWSRHRPRRAGLIERIWPQVADRPGRLNSRPRNGPSSKPTGVRILKRRRRPISDVASDPPNISKERLLAACIIAIAASRVKLVRRWSEQHRRQPATRGPSGGADGPMGLAPRPSSSGWRPSKDLGDGLVHCVAYQVARSITWDAGRTAMEI